MDETDKKILFAHLDERYNPLNVFRLVEGSWKQIPEDEAHEAYMTAPYDVYLEEDASAPSGFVWESDGTEVRGEFTGTPGALPNIDEVTAVYDEFVKALQRDNPTVAFCYVIAA